MWQCSGCDERIEDDFSACWRCGTDRRGRPTGAAVLPSNGSDAADEANRDAEDGWTIDAATAAADTEDPNSQTQISLSTLLVVLSVVAFYCALLRNGAVAFNGVLFIGSTALAVMMLMFFIGRWINRPQEPTDGADE